MLKIENGNLVVYWDWKKLYEVLKHFGWPVSFPIWLAIEAWKLTKEIIDWATDPKNADERQEVAVGLCLFGILIALIMDTFGML